MLAMSRSEHTESAAHTRHYTAHNMHTAHDMQAHFLLSLWLTMSANGRKQPASLTPSGVMLLTRGTPREALVRPTWAQNPLLVYVEQAQRKASL